MIYWEEDIRAQSRHLHELYVPTIVDIYRWHMTDCPSANMFGHSYSVDKRYQGSSGVSRDRGRAAKCLGYHPKADNTARL